MSHYQIIRFYAKRDKGVEIIATVSSLEEAQSHCNDPETSSRTCTSTEGKLRTEIHGDWFDGYAVVPRSAPKGILNAAAEIIAEDLRRNSPCFTALLLLAGLLIAAPAQAKERHRNYVIRRQQAGQVRGTPVLRIYSHGRKIDVYRDGSAYEKDGRVN